MVASSNHYSNLAKQLLYTKTKVGLFNEFRPITSVTNDSKLVNLTYKEFDYNRLVSSRTSESSNNLLLIRFGPNKKRSEFIDLC